MEGALDRGKPFALTRGRWKRSWLLERGSVLRALAGRDRERQRRPPPTLSAVDKSRGRGAPPGVGARPNPEMGLGCERWSRSSMYAVKRTSNWGRVAARQHGAGTAKALRSTSRWVAARRGIGR
jgi:hypothetical protein